MADSLVVHGQLELLGGGVASVNPLCPGAMFRLQPGFDLSAPQPTTDFVASLILDGERPFGRRAANRTIKLPIWIIAPTRAILAAAREVLEAAVDQDTWTLTWTRDPGPGGTALPMIIDCFRAQPTVPTYNTLFEKEILGLQVTLTIPALPYGRSDVQQQISFASPVPQSPSPPPLPVVLDTFTTIASPQCSQSTQCVVGPNTVCWDPDDPRVGDPGGQQTPFIYGAAFTSPQNLAGQQALQMWLGLGSRYYPNLEYHHRTSGVLVACTLTDVMGNTCSFSRGNMKLPVSPVWGQPVFTRCTIPLPPGPAGFNWAQVASYSLQITNRQYPSPRFGWVTCYLDHLAAVPPSVTYAPVTRGYVYTLNGIVGTARSPMSLSFTQPATAGTPSSLTSAGPGNYTVPPGTVWLSVDVTGGGGPGATMTVSGQGGGGGGGELGGETNFPASPGQVIPYLVGAGGTPGASPVAGQPSVFGPGPSGPLQVTGNGGLAAAENSATAGVGGSGSGNQLEYPGGAGRTASGGLGGGGGSSAGPAAPGSTPVGTGSVTYTSTGLWNCPAGVYQVLVECWAPGGGGGCGSASANGAGGGGGEYRNGYVSVTPGNNYNFTVGTGGAGGPGTGGGGQNGSAGSAATVFTGDGGHYVSASPGQGGGGNRWSGGGGQGGQGGTGPTGYPGGQGGPAQPYTGGGGSSAGPAAYGNAGGSPQGGTTPPGGGGGGRGSGSQAGTGTAGSAPGGGGGGTYTNGYAAGNGANGQVRITYPAVTGAPTSAGGAAVPGGGAGGAGASSTGAGTAGSAPGGGGGGGNSTGSTEAGGAGAAGQISVTPYGSQPFKSLIVHRPPLGANKMFQPLVSVGGGNDVPNGSSQYIMPQPVSGVNAAFSGTYTIYLINAAWNGSGSRTVSVTVTQYEYNGGASYTATTIPVTFTPAQVTNGILTAGVLTLPVKAVAADNTAGYYTVSVSDTNTSDRFYDCIFLDTQGSTVVINEPASGYITYYIDAPDPNVTLGTVLGSWSGRPAAISVMDACQAISGGPLAVEPADGENLLFAYSADGLAPAIGVNYSACWYFDRYE